MATQAQVAAVGHCHQTESHCLTERRLEHRLVYAESAVDQSYCRRLKEGVLKVVCLIEVVNQGKDSS